MYTYNIYFLYLCKSKEESFDLKADKIVQADGFNFRDGFCVFYSKVSDNEYVDVLVIPTARIALIEKV